MRIGSKHLSRLKMVALGYALLLRWHSLPFWPLLRAQVNSELQANLLPSESADTSDKLVNRPTALEAWIAQTGSEPPTGAAAHRQKAWDSCWTNKVCCNPPV